MHPTYHSYMLTAYFSRYEQYRLFDIFIFIPQEEEKELIALQAKKLSMENETRRKLEEQKIQRELQNKAMNMELLSYRMQQRISGPWTYSYFQHVPTPQKDSSSKKGVTKTRSIKKK